MVVTAHSLRAPVAGDPAVLQFELNSGEGVSVLRLEGSLRATPAAARRDLLREVDRVGGGALLVDASLLFEIDDAGVSLLTEVERRQRSQGGKVTVYAASGPVARALDRSPIAH